LNLAGSRGANRVREIVIGPVTPGYLRAKEKRKAYVDLRNLKSAGDLTL
jgi:hypothetical protein